MTWDSLISNLNLVMTSLWSWINTVTESLISNKIVVVVIFSFLVWFMFEKIFDLIESIKGGKLNEEDSE
jgi:Flp pilus assembly protein protease CpaA